MSDVTMHHNGANGAEGAGGAKAAAATAMFLWVVVVLALAYGVIETFQKVVDLFG